MTYRKKLESTLMPGVLLYTPCAFTPCVLQITSLCRHGKTTCKYLLRYHRFSLGPAGDVNFAKDRYLDLNFKRHYNPEAAAKEALMNLPRHLGSCEGYSSKERLLMAYPDDDLVLKFLTEVT